LASGHHWPRGFSQARSPLALTGNPGPLDFGELAPVYGLLPVASGALLWRSYLRAVAPRGQTPARPGETAAGR